uniref:PepSY domain-containing protein n=1 Tax=Phenylobacterium glaciei TaxID=2803784 RepID=A0A974P6D0_9CAUL|nr:PepSY domain-containing protein [Phenylobacterium glaciei]
MGRRRPGSSQPHLARRRRQRPGRRTGREPGGDQPSHPRRGPGLEDPAEPARGREPVTVAVNDTTGAAQAERASPSAAGGGPDPLSAWMRRVHDGADMGIVWQTLLVLAGLAPTLLCLTGLIMWLRRRAPAGDHARRHRLRPPIPLPPAPMTVRLRQRGNAHDLAGHRL